MNPQVLEVIEKSPLGEALGRDAMHFNLEIAVARYFGPAAVLVTFRRKSGDVEPMDAEGRS